MPACASCGNGGCSSNGGCNNGASDAPTCTPPSAADCSAGTGWWGDCTYSVSAMTNGQSGLSVSNNTTASPGYTGSATFSCNNTVRTISNATCVAVSPTLCSVTTDTNYNTGACSGSCANSGTNYPTCTPPTSPTSCVPNGCDSSDAGLFATYCTTEFCHRCDGTKRYGTMTSGTSVSGASCAVPHQCPPFQTWTGSRCVADGPVTGACGTPLHSAYGDCDSGTIGSGQPVRQPDDSYQWVCYGSDGGGDSPLCWYASHEFDPPSCANGGISISDPRCSSMWGTWVVSGCPARTCGQSSSQSTVACTNSSYCNPNTRPSPQFCPGSVACPTVSITVDGNPNNFSLSNFGHVGSLVWSSTNAASCSGGGDWTSTPGMSGSGNTGIFNVGKTYSYPYSCRNSDSSGVASKQVNVTVCPPETPVLHGGTCQALPEVTSFLLYYNYVPNAHFDILCGNSDSYDFGVVGSPVNHSGSSGTRAVSSNGNYAVTCKIRSDDGHLFTSGQQVKSYQTIPPPPLVSLKQTPATISKGTSDVVSPKSIPE